MVPHPPVEPDLVSCHNRVGSLLPTLGLEFLSSANGRSRTHGLVEQWVVSVATANAFNRSHGSVFEISIDQVQVGFEEEAGCVGRSWSASDDACHKVNRQL